MLKELSINFPETFVIEFNLISALLKAISKHGELIGTKEEVSLLTGIPTGKSSGKVAPMIKYAFAIGLVDYEYRNSQWTLKLTKLGEVVYEEDLGFIEPITILISHLMFCRRVNLEAIPLGIVDPWFQLFANSHICLGQSFDSSEMKKFIFGNQEIKPSFNKFASILIRTYTNPDSKFYGLNLLKFDGDKLKRGQAPRVREYYPAYSVFMFLAWDCYLKDTKQIELDRFLDEIGFFSLLNWSKAQSLDWINWMESKKFVQVDRQTGTALALRTASTDIIIDALYSEVV